VDRMAIERHLSDCHINIKKYKKLSKILGNIKDASKDEQEMILKFTKKCYGSEPDRNKAKEQAEHFLATLFGSCKDLYYFGPNKALEKHVKTALQQDEKDDEPVVKAELINIKAQTSDVENWNGEIKRTPSSRGTLWTRKMKHYLIGPTLGVGGTAKVKLGLDTKKDNMEVAVKILKPRYAKDAGREIETLRDLKHRNIIQLFDEFSNVQFGAKLPTSVFVLEFANKGELIEYLMYTGKFEPILARWMFNDLVEAVDYIHKHGFCHRDLKHDNCLLGQQFVLKITDFGFAAPIGEWGDKLMKTAIGTEQYAAPEILKHQKYDKAVDIFAMGVMLFIALAGCQPFMRADSRDRWYSLIMKGDWKGFWKYHITRAHRFKEESIDLLQKMLTPLAKDRITIDQIRKHKFLSQQKVSQSKAAEMLMKRKEKVDKEKWKAGDLSNAGPTRAINGTWPTPPEFWSDKPPQTPFWFFSDHSASTIQESIKEYIENHDPAGLGGRCVMRKVKDDETFDLGEFLLSEGDYDSPAEYLSDGKESPYNVKFEVVVQKKNVYGLWRIYTERGGKKRTDYMKQKTKFVDEMEARLKEERDQALKDINDEKDAEAKLEETIDNKRSEMLEKAGYKNSVLYYSEDDREKLGLRNIVIFSRYREPKKKYKTIKSADGQKLQVRKMDHNKKFFPEVYKLILSQLAAVLMTMDDKITAVDSGKDEKES